MFASNELKLQKNRLASFSFKFTNILKGFCGQIITAHLTGIMHKFNKGVFKAEGTSVFLHYVFLFLAAAINLLQTFFLSF